jgi:hypothetical protein
MRPRSPLVVVAVLVVASTLTTAVATAASDLEWQRRIADRADGIAVDDRGNVYVAASTGWTADRSPIAILARFGPQGRLVWTRRWDPSRAWARSVDVAVGPDGSAYLAGRVGVEGYEGGAWFVARYAPDGRLLWRRTTPGWRDLLATTVTSVAVGAGMVVIGGYGFGCCSEASDEGFVRAYTLEGDLLWHHDVRGPGRLASNHDGVGDVAVGAEGSVFLTGWVETRPRTDVSERTDVEVLIQKLSAGGAEIWTRVLHDHLGRDGDHGVGISARGNVLAVTAYMGGPAWVELRGADVGQAWLARLGFDGRIRWTATWGTQGRDAAQPEAVSVGPDGTIYVVGARRDLDGPGIDAFARAYSRVGRLRWDVILADGSASHRATDVEPSGATLVASGYRLTEPYEVAGGFVWWRVLDRR